ncbi:MAG: M15 family metallopeptidase [Alloprevotella sp.]
MVRFLFLLVMLLPAYARASDSEVLRHWRVGQTVSEAAVTAYGEERCFAVVEIPDSILRLMQGRSLPKECRTDVATLRYLRLLHRDAHGHIRLGEMVCHRDVARSLVSIFRSLYQQAYPIERMLLIDRFGADDEQSMAANNTSCFNFRRVAGSSRLSKHALGKAVDVNPLYNPCVRRGADGKIRVSPAAGKAYADRSLPTPYRLLRDDAAHRLFRSHGFQWGGAWRSLKDYQHFEMP